MPKKQALVPIKPTADMQKASKAEVAQMRKALADGLARVEAMDNAADVATMWVAANTIKGDLAVLERAAAQRMITLAPIETYNYTPKGGEREVRERPAKEQVVDGVGVITIERSANRKWGNPKELAHAMVDVKCAADGGEFMSAHATINFLFEVFSVGDPRVTVMRDMGLGAFDDEPWVMADYTTSARVK